MRSAGALRRNEGIEVFRRPKNADDRAFTSHKAVWANDLRIGEIAEKIGIKSGGIVGVIAPAVGHNEEVGGAVRKGDGIGQRAVLVKLRFEVRNAFDCAHGVYMLLDVLNRAHSVD